MSLIALLIAIIIVGVIWYCARLLIAAFTIPEPIASVIYVILVLICLIYVLGLIGYGPMVRFRLI